MELLAASVKGGNRRRMVCGEGNKQSRKKRNIKKYLMWGPWRGEKSQQAGVEEGRVQAGIADRRAGAATLQNLDLPQ